MLRLNSKTYVEGMTFPDALWWAFVTATTVGYGDISPSSGIGRIIAAVLMLVGIGLLGALTSSITSFFLKEKERESYNSERVSLALTVYDQLSESEREMFQTEINRKRNEGEKNGKEKEPGPRPVIQLETGARDHKSEKENFKSNRHPNE